MNDNATILLAQIIAGVASVLGVWLVNYYQNKRDDEKREAEEKQAAENGRTERARLRAELEDNAQQFINDTFEDMRIRIASLEDELERQSKKYELKITKLTDNHEAQLASLRASMKELQDMVDKQARRIEMLENENGRLQAENHKLRTGSGKMGL